MEGGGGNRPIRASAFGGVGSIFASSTSGGLEPLSRVFRGLLQVLTIWCWGLVNETEEVLARG